jgi:hypothetical protein
MDTDFDLCESFPELCGTIVIPVFEAPETGKGALTADLGTGMFTYTCNAEVNTSIYEALVFFFAF